MNKLYLLLFFIYGLVLITPAAIDLTNTKPAEQICENKTIEDNGSLLSDYQECIRKNNLDDIGSKRSVNRRTHIRFAVWGGIFWLIGGILYWHHTKD